MSPPTLVMTEFDALDLDEIPLGVLEDLDDLDELGDLDEPSNNGEELKDNAEDDREHRLEAGPEVLEHEAVEGGGETRRREEEDEVPSKKARMASVSKAVSHVSMKRIIEELEKDPRLMIKKGNRRQRRTASQAIARGVVSEAYSLPRIAETAVKMGLTAGLSLDLTTCDEHGVPWDFSKKERQDEAKRRLADQEPALLIACPMCGPFSSWIGVNYQRVDEN